MGRHLAIGDIHGCYRALMTLVDFVGVRDDDIVITLGDYVDRGPETPAVLNWLIEISKTGRLIPLRGNHELMMLRARDDSDELKHWIWCGGDAVLRSYAPAGRDGTLLDVPENHWQFLEERLLAWHEIETHFFVHANAWPDFPLDEQPDLMLYWEPLGWPPPHQSGKVMVCGHTSQKTGLPEYFGHAVCIDTWACGEGWLTCLDPATGEYWQANQKGETRKAFLDELA